MARRTVGGRLVRSPLNPLWTVGQGLRGAGQMAYSAMPAMSRLGDQLVDTLSQAGLGDAGKEIGSFLAGNIGKSIGQDAIGGVNLADLGGKVGQQLASTAPKMLGRAAMGGAAEGLLGGGSFLSGGGEPGDMALRQAALFGSMPKIDGNPFKVQAPGEALDPDVDGPGEFRSPKMLSAEPESDADALMRGTTFGFEPIAGLGKNLLTPEEYAPLVAQLAGRESQAPGGLKRSMIPPPNGGRTALGAFGVAKSAADIPDPDNPHIQPVAVMAPETVLGGEDPLRSALGRRAQIQLGGPRNMGEVRRPATPSALSTFMDEAEEAAGLGKRRPRRVR